MTRRLLTDTGAYVRYRASSCDMIPEQPYSRQKHFVRFSLMLPFKSCPVLTSIFVSMRYTFDATRATSRYTRSLSLLELISSVLRLTCVSHTHVNILPLALESFL